MAGRESESDVTNPSVFFCPHGQSQDARGWDAFDDSHTNILPKMHEVHNLALAMSRDRGRAVVASKVSWPAHTV